MTEIEQQDTEQTFDDKALAPLSPGARVVAIETAEELLIVMRNEVAAMQRPWQQMNEREQGKALQTMRDAVLKAVADLTNRVASKDRRLIHAHVESVTFKGGDVKATLSCSHSNEQRHDLADSSGTDVLLVATDGSEWQGDPWSVRPEPDQGELPLADEDGVELWIVACCPHDGDVCTRQCHEEGAVCWRKAHDHHVDPPRNGFPEEGDQPVLDEVPVNEIPSGVAHIGDEDLPEEGEAGGNAG